MYESHLALHGVAVKKHAAAAAVADLVGLPVERVATLLERAVAGGRAACANDKYLLTPAGRMIVEAQYSRYYSAPPA
jgi:pyruvate,orthophosphate dikinase